SNDQTGVNRETFSADETGSDAGAYYMLEHTPEDVTVAEPLVARTRERRMIRHLVFDRKPTKTTLGEVYLHITAQPPLRADRKHVADDHHPDHEPRIDLGPIDGGNRAQARNGPRTGHERQQSCERDDRPVPPPQGRTNKTAVPVRD